MHRHPLAWTLLRATPVASALIAFAVGAAAFGGWILDIRVLTSVRPGWAATQPWTAVCLMVCGAALATAAGGPRRGPRAALTALLSAGVLTVSAVSLAADATGAAVGIDRWLFADAVARQAARYPGRMSTATALSLVLFALALLTTVRPRLPRAVFRAAGVGGLLIATTGVFGHVYNVAALYSVPPFRTMGVLTACALTLLFIGLLTLRPLTGIARVIAQRSMGGSLARFHVPLLVMAPIGLFGTIQVVATLFRLHPDFRPAAFTAATTLMLGGLGLWTAMRMDQLERARRRADAARRESEEWLTGTVQAVPVGVVQVDFDRRFQRVNPRFCAITGYDEAELLSRGPLDITHPDDRPRDLEAMRRLSAGTIDGYGVEKRYIRRDGRVIWVRLTLTLIRNAETGAPRHCLAVVEDIDAGKREEEALRERAERLALISDVTARLLQVARPEELIRSIATRLRTLLGVDVFLHYAAEDGPGLTLVAHGGVTERDAAAMRELTYGEALCGNVAATRTAVVVEDVQGGTDPRAALARSLGITAYACQPLVAEGRLVGTISFGSRRLRRFDGETLTVMRTICDQVAIAIARRRDEQALRAAKEEADRAMVAKAKFLAAASHDLRQPVQSLMLLSGAMAGRVQQDAGGRMLLEHQNLALDALKDLLDALLDIARLDSGAVLPDVTELPVMTLFQKLRVGFGPRAEARGLRLRIVSCDAWIRSDALLLGRILGNLVENAIKYTNGGRILVGCRRRGDRLRILVADSGIGIAPEHLGDIFEEFAQVNNPHRDRSQGLGLGLAIVKRLASLLGHRVRVRSVPGRGSTFTVDVPLVTPRHPIAADRTAVPTEDRDHGVVALIDDEVMIRSAMRSSLTEWGYHVVCASSADETLEALAAAGVRPDVLVTDYHLTARSNGVEAIGRVRAVHGPELPCILLTGDTASGRLTDARREGFLLLHKPCTPADLRAAIRRVREESGGSTAGASEGAA